MRIRQAIMWAWPILKSIDFDFFLFDCWDKHTQGAGEWQTASLIRF